MVHIGMILSHAFGDLFGPDARTAPGRRPEPKPRLRRARPARDTRLGRETHRATALIRAWRRDPVLEVRPLDTFPSPYPGDDSRPASGRL